MNSKIASIAIIGVLVVSGGIGAFYFLQNNADSGDLSFLDGTHIADFKDYKYIGAGLTVNGPDPTSNMMSAPAYRNIGDEGDSSKYKLVGITSSGECSVLDFLDSDGKRITQDANLVYFASEKAYSIVVFSTKSSGYILAGHSVMAVDVDYHEIGISDDGQQQVDHSKVDDSYGFIIDNTYGNVYSVDTIISRMVDGHNLNQVSLYSKGEYVYAYAHQGDSGLYSFRFTESELQIEMKMDHEQIDNFIQDYSQNWSSMPPAVDVYGNILSCNAVSYATSDTRIMKNDGRFSTLGDEDPLYDPNLGYDYQMSFNGIVYARAYDLNTSSDTPVYTSYLGSDGKFTVTDAPAISGRLLGHTSDVGVFVCSETPANTSVYLSVLRFDATTPWTYTVDRMDLFSSHDSTECYTFMRNCAFNGTNVYSFYGNMLYDANIQDLTLNKINSPNQIRSITFDDKVYAVKITATIVETMRTVDGYIDETKVGADKLIFEPYNLKYNDHQIIHIAPINT